MKTKGGNMKSDNMKTKGNMKTKRRVKTKRRKNDDGYFAFFYFYDFNGNFLKSGIYTDNRRRLR